MFPGTKITIDGEDFVVPALSLGLLRNGIMAKLKEHDEVLAAGNVFEAMAMRGEIILAALRRNYPDFSEDKLLSHLDLQNTVGIWLNVLGSSGFSPGEVQAAAKAASSSETPEIGGTSDPSIAA